MFKLVDGDDFPVVGNIIVRNTKEATAFIAYM
jgi:hypothetical protein